MPQLDAPGILHHVIIPGIERRDIFKDKIDMASIQRKSIKRVARIMYRPKFSQTHFIFIFQPTPVKNPRFVMLPQDLQGSPIPAKPAQAHLKIGRSFRI